MCPIAHAIINEFAMDVLICWQSLDDLYNYKLKIFYGKKPVNLNQAFVLWFSKQVTTVMNTLNKRNLAIRPFFRIFTQFFS